MANTHKRCLPCTLLVHVRLNRLNFFFLFAMQGFPDMVVWNISLLGGIDLTYTPQQQPFQALRNAFSGKVFPGNQERKEEERKE